MNYLSISLYKFLIERILHYLVQHKKIISHSSICFKIIYVKRVRIQSLCHSLILNILQFDWMRTDGYTAMLMYIMCIIWCISKITFLHQQIYNVTFIFIYFNDSWYHIWGNTTDVSCQNFSVSSFQIYRCRHYTSKWNIMV